MRHKRLCVNCTLFAIILPIVLPCLQAKTCAIIGVRENGYLRSLAFDEKLSSDQKSHNMLDGFRLLSDVERSSAHRQRYDTVKWKRFEEFLSSVSHGQGQIEVESGRYYVPIPLYALKITLSMIDKISGGLKNLRILDIGTGKDLRVSLAVVNSYGAKNVTAVEIDNDISNTASECLIEHAPQHNIDTDGVVFKPSTDALDISWDNFDVAFFFYTQPAGLEKAAEFRTKFQKKVYEMPEGGLLVIWFTNAQFDRGWWKEFPMLESIMDVRLIEKTDGTGIDLVVYEAKKDLPPMAQTIEKAINHLHGRSV